MTALVTMEAEHLDQVHAIETAATPDPWSRELLATELDDVGPDRHWLVAIQDGDVVGFGGLLFIVDEAHIMNLAVRPDRQRQGLASMLVSRLLRDAGDRGATGVTLEVRVSNRPAIALYEMFGFEHVGRRPRYYADGEDAAIMWVHKIHRPEFRDRLGPSGLIGSQ